ncbi:MAG: hypothetical protein D3910_04630 [Candidatus Electrothrix sp. ATG2]|nr:hypothetical protein [Candidatus Electrothrix sp. ATG2]
MTDCTPDLIITQYRFTFTAQDHLTLPLYPWLRTSWRAWTKENHLAAVLPVQVAKLVLTSTILLFAAGSISVGAYNPFIYFRF